MNVKVLVDMQLCLLFLHLQWSSILFLPINVTSNSKNMHQKELLSSRDNDDTSNHKKFFLHFLHRAPLFIMERFNKCEFYYYFNFFFTLGTLNGTLNPDG